MQFIYAESRFVMPDHTCQQHFWCSTFIFCYSFKTNFVLDFCFWAPPTGNSTIADSEGIEVGWCTKNGYGTRGVIPGTFTGLQVLKTSQYIQYVGFINQPLVNIQASDYGGELDSAGQDGVRGFMRFFPCDHF